MNNELDQRESKVMDFINAKNMELSNKSAIDAINASPDVKMRKLSGEADAAKSVCIDTILGKLYKDALPFDDPEKNCSDDDARNIMHDYISKRTNGKNSEYYVREAIKKNNSSTLKTLINEAEAISKKFFKEAAKDIGKINISDLNFNPNSQNIALNQITKKMELDDISDIIRNNVNKAIQDESNKAKAEDEYNQNIEDQLANDLTVTDDTSMESAMGKINMITQPVVYQPSLFEAIMIKKVGTMTESTGNDVFKEAVREYTKLNISKALRLESFNINNIKSLTNSYLV